MKEELTREVIRWCVTVEAYCIDEDGDRCNEYGDVEYFATEEKAIKRANEIEEEMKEEMKDEEAQGSYDVTVTMEDGHWITEREYQNYYADDIEGVIITD